MSHLGRPKEDSFDASASLAPVADRLGELLDTPVALLSGLEDCSKVQAGQVALLENVRFLRGEKLTMSHWRDVWLRFAMYLSWTRLVPPIGRKRPRMASRSTRQGYARDCYSTGNSKPFSKH